MKRPTIFWVGMVTPDTIGKFLRPLAELNGFDLEQGTGSRAGFARAYMHRLVRENHPR
jgi:hypothetical protein